MCYSAQIQADYRKYVRLWGADIDLREFHRLYWDRSQGARIKIPKAMDAAFANPANKDEQAIKALIDAWDAQEASRLEQDLFRQRKRLADAERVLSTKPTKAAAESRRIASAKVAWILGKLAALRRSEPLDEDARIFPGWYAPVMLVREGRRVVMPMRYQCRSAGKPASCDRKFPGTYNARRDNLEGFWKKQFGHTHAIMVVNAFFENVSRHAMEHRELAAGEKDENVVLEFRPRPQHDMLVACIWSHWQDAGEDLYSFAAVTDDPPAEIAAAGHDRCIVPIKPEHVDAWLNPDAQDLGALYAILDDRDRPYYEHRMAA
ncbi:MAG: SOS response-associated peptidase family protein [Rhodanobacteraceae bacterium]